MSAEQESEVQKLICDKTPDQMKMPYALWGRTAVMELIDQWFAIGVKMFKRTLFRIVRNLILNSGYAEKIAFLSMATSLALERVFSRDLPINSVVDVGASNGSWSLEARTYLRDVHFHLIEANSFHQKELQLLCNSTPKFSYVLAAASDQVGSIFFDGRDQFGGVAMKNKGEGSELLPAVTIDSEVKIKKLPGPYLIKLDTHGFEVPILNGAKETLLNTNLVVIETYNYQLEPDSLKFFQMCQFMDELGFGVIDISEPVWRSKDGAFWQIDLFFVPKDRPELSCNGFQ